MPAQNGINAPASYASAHNAVHGDYSLPTGLLLAVATATIASAPLLHALTAPFAVGVLSLISVTIVVSAPTWAPSIAIFVLLFQNLFVSILSPLIPDVAALEFIKGYNFLICSVMWLTTFYLFMVRQRNRSDSVNRLMVQSTIVIGLVLIYFAYGFLQNGIVAAIYLRNIVLPILLFQLALVTAATFEVRVTPTLVAIAIVFIVCGYIELSFRDFWLYVTNGRTYWGFDEIKATASGVWERQMRITGNVFVDLEDRFKFNFLNTPLLDDLGLMEIYRIFGPNISAISYAYGLGFFCLFLFSVGRPVLALSAIPLAIFCSVKGALIMMLFVFGSWVSTRLIGAVATLWIGLAVLVGYAIWGLYLGLQIGDYHVIGFMGGWQGFVQAPFGRGLGTGGNFSEAFSSIDWSAAQQAGAIDGAAESAVGVLLYQMGIATFALLGLYFSIGMKAWRLFAVSGISTQGLAAFGIFVVLVNGIFQEEALFSPPAIGLILCLAGTVIGNAIRVEKMPNRKS